MTNTEFNRRADKARLSAGWSHDRRYYNFMREHDSRVAFTEPRSASGLASALIGVMCFFALILIALLLGAY